MACKICNGDTARVLGGRLLNKYDVSYHRCNVCGLVQTDQPTWLDEAYSSAISSVDLGPISRSIKNARIVETLLLTAFDSGAEYIDWGAGYGVFVRMMRDLGYGFRWLDQNCENIFAKHFVAENGKQYELLTTFEVFEHLPDPVESFDGMMSYAESVFLSTELIPPGGIKGWWYLTPETGQHVTFYTLDALRRLGERHGLTLYSNGSDFHLLTRRRVHKRLFEIAVQDGRAARIVRMVMRRRRGKKSLLRSDWAAVSGWDV